ncbi:hypothetical protein [Gemmatimonas sp.]|uniref:hypothetical protein n=1 Tax=Gemmatimonas sp. TaxID=1962908 RepID=UPI0039832D2A
MYDSAVPRLSSLVDHLLNEDSAPFHQLHADDPAVLVLDSTPVGSRHRWAPPTGVRFWPCLDSVIGDSRRRGGASRLLTGR